MKYKVEYINGYAVLVDKDAEIKKSEIYLLLPENKIKIAQNSLPKNQREWVKIIAAEKELNLEVPILPSPIGFAKLQASIRLDEMGQKGNCIDVNDLEKLFKYFKAAHNKERPKAKVITYVVIESEEYGHYEMAIDTIIKHGDRPKLIINSEGKKSVKIKELIYE